MLLLVSSAFALHTKVFDPDPALTRAPLAGLEQLYVDPATTRILPLPGRPAGPAEVYANAVPPGDPALVFTNPLTYWGELTVNGTTVGILGPYATLRFEVHCLEVREAR